MTPTPFIHYEVVWKNKSVPFFTFERGREMNMSIGEGNIGLRPHSFRFVVLVVLCGLLLPACDTQNNDKPEPPKLESRNSVSQPTLNVNSQSSVVLSQKSAADDINDPLSSEIKAHRYSGDLDDLEEVLLAAGYKELSGIVAKSGDATHPYDRSSNVTGAEWCILDTSKQPVVLKRCVYAVQTIIGRDSTGKQIFQTEDALEFVPVSGFKFLDEDTNCTSPLYPYRTVVAIGRFKWRKDPGYGGYAENIRQAWVIDVESKKFVEISTQEVTCEINEDRD